jgi:hypothetical protein
MRGCLEMLEIEVAGIKIWAHAYVVPDAPYRLLLGHPWQHLVKLLKTETNDSISVTIHVLETMLEGWIRKEGLGLSSYAVPLTRVRAPDFGMKSRTHPTKFS